MTELKTHPVEGWAEVDFNSEPFLSDFKQVYENLHNGGCPFAHSPTGDTPVAQSRRISKSGGPASAGDGKAPPPIWAPAQIGGGGPPPPPAAAGLVPSSHNP